MILSPLNFIPLIIASRAMRNIFELIKHDLLVYLMKNFSPEIALKKEDVDLLVAGKLWFESKLDIFLQDRDLFKGIVEVCKVG